MYGPPQVKDMVAFFFPPPFLHEYRAAARQRHVGTLAGHDRPKKGRTSAGRAICLGAGS